MNEVKVQSAIDDIALTLRAKGWKFTKTTKKAMKELEELGLTRFVSSQNMPCAEIVNEIIKQAKQAGGKKVMQSGWNFGGEDGYSQTTITEPSALYLAINETEPEPEPEPAPEAEAEPVTVTPKAAMLTAAVALKIATSVSLTDGAKKLAQQIASLEDQQRAAALRNAKSGYRGFILTASSLDQQLIELRLLHRDMVAVTPETANQIYNRWVPWFRTFHIAEHGRLNTQEAADFLGVSRQAVQRAILRGTLPAEKENRDNYIPIDALIEYQGKYLRKPGRK